mmetsp:Transcript_111069/g.278087  ORF Transcript_111069/g.278087 Transcript_111069/m.278087 type:complete len:87 (+) Transcript_111069:2-262(+)
MTFDRIIANFGRDITTKVLIEEPLPLWAQQSGGLRGASQQPRGEFHKPVHGVIALEPGSASDVPPRWWLTPSAASLPAVPNDHGSQ